MTERPDTPIFRAIVDARGQITIPEGTRKARGIKPKDEVDVYDLRKVEKI